MLSVIIPRCIQLICAMNVCSTLTTVDGKIIACITMRLPGVTGSEDVDSTIPLCLASGNKKDTALGLKNPLHHII